MSCRRERGSDHSIGLLEKRHPTVRMTKAGGLANLSRGKGAMGFAEYSNYDGLALAELVKEKEVEPSEYRAYCRGTDAQRPKSKPGAHRPAVDVPGLLCRPLEPERASPRQSSRAMIIAAAAKQLGGMAKSTANIFRRCPSRTPIFSRS
jgi:hypothetical protein